MGPHPQQPPLLASRRRNNDSLFESGTSFPRALGTAQASLSPTGRSLRPAPHLNRQAPVRLPTRRNLPTFLFPSSRSGILHGPCQ
jgi:hypothetical protein